MKRKLLVLCFIWPVLVHSVSPEKAFVNLAKKVRASVVNISTTREGESNILQIFPGYFIMPPLTPQIAASGSGFIVDKNGLIITNSHVVQNFDKIQIQFAGDEKLYPAKVLGADSLSDIALLKVTVKKKLIPIRLGDSEKLEVGEWVAAIGNPHGYGHTMTKGIISAVKREIDDLNLFPLLQTDASINPGNSGGPLVNLKGEVVGVNQAIARGAVGISFAIPINNVKEVLTDLKSFGFVKRGFIGVEFRSDGQEGAVITNIVSGSPAEKAGLKIRDRIISFAGKKIKTAKQLPNAVQKTKPGKKVFLQVMRRNKKVQLSIIPQIIQKNNFSAFQTSPRNKQKNIRGQSVKGGFQIVPANPSHLSALKQPDLGARNPLVISIKANSPADRSGLMIGDLIFQINGQKISTVSEVRRAIRNGNNRLSILRYHQRYDKYLLISITLSL